MTDNEQTNRNQTAFAQPTMMRVSRRLVWLWTMLLLVPWVLLAVAMGPQWVKERVRAWGASTTGRNGLVQRCKPGPWGDVEFTRIVIEPPEAFVAMSFDPDKPIQWVLAGYAPDTLGRLWNDVGLTASQQQALAAVTRWDNAAGKVVITPGHDLVLGLDRNVRARLYNVLGQFPENHLQAHPYQFRTDVVEEWLADSDLSERTVRLIKQMLYPRGACSLFADQDVLLPMLETPKERARAIKTLARTSSVLVRLRVKPDSDIDALAGYWGRGRRLKDIRPLLASLPKVAGGYTIDIGHLLPAFARKLLYTYPNPDSDMDSIREDCHWTSLNFFKDAPDDRFQSVDYVRQIIESDYYPVLGEPTFGDLIFLMSKKGEVPHSCVYIADNIVFTKNGSESYVPWVFMELTDVRALYYADPPLEVKIYRHKQM